MGVRKHAVIVASGEKTFKFHGKLGNTVYLLCCLAMLLGVLSLFKTDETPPKSTLMAKLVATAIIVLGAVLFLQPCKLSLVVSHGITLLSKRDIQGHS